MALDLDLDSHSPVRQALRRLRKHDAPGVFSRPADRRALWQERLREYVKNEVDTGVAPQERVPRESARAHLGEG